MRAGRAFKEYDEYQARREAGPKYNWFKHKDPKQSITIRLLWDLDDGLALWRHDTGGGYWDTCTRNEEYGVDDCPHCAEKIKAAQFWTYPIWNYATKQMELVSWKSTSFSPLGHLRAYKDQDGTVLERDFILRKILTTQKTPEGKDVYQSIAIPNPPTAFTEAVELPSYEDLVDYLKPRVLREKVAVGG